MNTKYATVVCREIRDSFKISGVRSSAVNPPSNRFNCRDVASFEIIEVNCVFSLRIRCIFTFVNCLIRYFCFTPALTLQYFGLDVTDQQFASK